MTSTVPPNPPIKDEKSFAFGAQRRRRNRHGQLVLELPSGLAKRCLECGLVKPLSDYYLDTSNPRRKGRTKTARCKKCYNARRRESGRVSSMHWYLKNRYGITMEQYDAMRSEQEYRCAVCRRHEDELAQDASLGKNRRLEVDHCHKIGEVRGLLCNACNLALGRLKDDPTVLFRAFLYLEQRLETLAVS